MEGAHLSAKLMMQDGRVYVDSYGRPARLRSGPPAAPVITFPGNNDTIGDTLVVRGTAQPNATVTMKIQYVNRVLGIVGVRGTAGQQDIKVSPDGKWISAPINLASIFGRRDTEYTLSAVVLSTTNEQSAVTTVRFK